jgi:hypothetical protein
MRKARVPKYIKAMEREDLERAHADAMEKIQDFSQRANARFLSEEKLAVQLIRHCETPMDWVPQLERGELVVILEAIKRAKNGA